MALLKEIADINPRETIKKGTLATKIAMDKLMPFTRDVPEVERTAFSGGTKFRNGDTIMARITPCLENGKTAKVNCLQKDEVGFGSTEYIVFRAKKGITDPDFLYYLVCSPLVREPAIKSMVGSSGRQRVQTDIVENLNLDIPSFEDQKRIGTVLRELDDKIQINGQINKNLEDQFRLIYANTFMDMRSDEWPIVPLTELFLFQEGPGIRNWQYVTKDGTKFINIRCIRDGDIFTETANMISKNEANGKYSHFMLKPFDIVMSCSGTLGRYAIVQERHLPLCLNTSVIRFAAHRGMLDFPYLYGYLTSAEFLQRQEEMAAGSVQKNFGPTHLKKMVVCNAPIELRDSFYSLTMPIINNILNNRNENERLSQLRDVLLPKLMSGELDVSDIDI